MMLMASVAFGIALTGFGETVTNVRGSQRPNSNLVDIYYDLNATDGGTYTVEVAIEGRTDTVTATTFSGDVGKGIAPGKNHHIVWDAGADWRGKKSDVKAVVTATVEARQGEPKKVQLWAGGPRWADRNIGADKPEDYGLYFWWGDTTGHRPGYNFNEYNSAIYTYVKSVSQLQSAGWLTSGGVLAPAHDAAHVKWGGSWRMPTDAEFSALINNCDWTWKPRNGVNGYIVRGRGAYASNSIFLPCAGRGWGTSHNDAGSYGYYWSSVPYSGSRQYSWLLCFSSSPYHGTFDSYRFFGQSVRPVQGFTH